MTITASRQKPTVRAIARDELDSWLALPGTDAPPDSRLDRRIRGAWESGEGGPDQTFLLERDRRPIGRLAWTTSPVGSVLPDTLETTLAGLWLPWHAPDAVELGLALVGAALPAVPPGATAVDAWVNQEYMPGTAVRRAVFEAAGFALFQEKEGFLWQAEDAPAPARDLDRRLSFRPLDEAGRDLLASVMSRSTRGTLDRQDRYYAALVGEESWGREMLGYLTDEDAPSWLVAFDAAGEPVGFVLLGTFDEPDRGTIVHIGVVPEARGRGYVAELLAEVDVRARGRGFKRILSDADVENHPMRAALERAGHRSDATAWHVWHYRLEPVRRDTPNRLP